LEFRLHNLRGAGSEAFICRKLNFRPVVESLSIHGIPNGRGYKIDVIVSIQVDAQIDKAAYSEPVAYNTEGDPSGLQGLNLKDGGIQSLQKDNDRVDFKS
jgi:hypothetical protein